MARSQDKSPVPKVVAATGGAGLGYSVQVILIWIIEYFAGLDIPTEVENATGFILTTLVAFLGGYFAPPVGAAAAQDQPEGD